MILAVLALLVMAFAGIPPITMGSAYFVETRTTTHSVHFHWSLTIMACIFLSGLALTVFPSRENAS